MCGSSRPVQHQTAIENFRSVNDSFARLCFSKKVTVIRSVYFSTVCPVPSAESELMMYPCTIGDVNSSFGHNTHHPAQRRLSSTPAAGRWLRRPDFVARHGTVDGCSFSDGVRAAATVDADADADAERRMWNVADRISLLQHIAQ
jgi:alpha-galactosidase